MGLYGHVTRHVCGATGEGLDEATVRKVAGAVTREGVWLKAFRDPSVVAGWLDDGWWIDPEPGFLMRVPPAPDGAAASPRATGCASGRAEG
ncbi:hypothetical protein GCM10017668_48100 [Streptomyces tuirus]|uniref:Uncharacterized protein n=2 Tax=Streptomyces tuirus TaxID=68278 RepID=A0A7G1NMM3_9ACTN|nr:hypothetical protein GCM10017668_48100 [Streptomyces tuirus]